MVPRLNVPVEEEDDSFGPGTDLVLSLFAMMLLLSGMSWSTQAVGKLRGPQHIAELSDSLFARGSDEITKAVRDGIELERGKVHRLFAEGRINGLRLEGYASPEGGDNLRLSADRTVAVMKEIHRSLKVPYECMYVTGYGSSDSAILRKWLKADPARTLRTWAGGEGQGISEEKMKPERRVKLVGVWVPDSVCVWKP